MRDEKNRMQNKLNSLLLSTLNGLTSYSQSMSTDKISASQLLDPLSSWCKPPPPAKKPTPHLIANILGFNASHSANNTGNMALSNHAHLHASHLHANSSPLDDYRSSSVSSCSSSSSSNYHSSIASTASVTAAINSATISGKNHHHQTSHRHRKVNVSIMRLGPY